MVSYTDDVNMKSKIVSKTYFQDLLKVNEEEYRLLQSVRLGDGNCVQICVPSTISISQKLSLERKLITHPNLIIKVWRRKTLPIENCQAEYVTCVNSLTTATSISAVRKHLLQWSFLHLNRVKIMLIFSLWKFVQKIGWSWSMLPAIMEVEEKFEKKKRKGGKSNKPADGSWPLPLKVMEVDKKMK